MKKKISFLALVFMCVMAFSGLLVACSKDGETDDGASNKQIEYSANLNIVVRDAYSSPVAGAVVTLAENANKQATTNANGVVTFEKLPVGDYWFEVAKEGFATVTGAAQVGYGLADNAIVPEIATEVAILQQIGASVTGRAVYTENDTTKLAADAQIRLELSDFSLVSRVYTTTTDVNGIYTFADLPEDASFRIYPEEITKNNITYSADSLNNQTGKTWEAVKKIPSDISYTVKTGQFTVTTLDSFRLSTNTEDVVINFSMPVQTASIVANDITVVANPVISNLFVNKTWSNNNKTLTITPLSGTWGKNTKSLSINLNNSNIKSDTNIKLGSGTTTLTAYLPGSTVDLPSAPSGLALTDDSDKNIEDGTGTVFKIQWNKTVGATYAIYYRNIKSAGYTQITSSYNPGANNAIYNIGSYFNAMDFVNNEKFEVIVYAIVDGVQSATPAKLSIAQSSVFRFTAIENNTTYSVSRYLGASTSASIPDNYNGKPITKIDNSVFKQKTNLESVYIPSSITSIGEDAFNGCINLESVSIPETVKSIGARAFQNTAIINNMAYNDVVYLSDWVIGYKGNLVDVSLINTTKGIVGGAFENCTTLESIDIPESVKSIGKNTFYGCSRLESITLPSSITIIESNLFYGCTNLENVTILGRITIIGDYAFAYCSSLIDIVIPTSVTIIDRSAFYKCTSLASIIIPIGVTKIEYGAFDDCSSLTINAQAASKPTEWNQYWNLDNRPVNWNYSA